MTLQGDLATLDLSALLQNLESNGRTGTLSLEGPGGKTCVLVREGKVSAYARKGRPTLMQTLVASGAIRAQDLEEVQRKRRGRGGSLGELLVAMGRIAEQELVEAARSRLLDDLCELVCMQAGEFSFQRGAVPRGVFDAEERRLELALPTGALLLEAARRSDHWVIIRTWVPSDSVHLIAVRKPELPEEPARRELCERLLERIDGTRSVAEALCAFPHQRFEAYLLLTEWLQAKRLRAADRDELERLAERLAPVDAERAFAITERGLEDQPRHAGLLRLRARLAEELDDALAAVEALKLLVQIELASADREAARAHLAAACALEPADTALWERTFALALEEGRTADAIEAGERLAGLYREPGLHRRVAAIYTRLVELAPAEWSLRREQARARIDCGDVAAAIEALERHGRTLIAVEAYAEARAVYEEILEHLPAHASAREAIRELDEGTYARRRARRRLLQRVSLAALAAAACLALLFKEVSARRDYSAAQRTVSERRWIEDQRYAEAIAEFEAVRARHAWTPTALFDVRPRLAELRAKLAPTGEH
jgi:tetratricopeptide (TPR) repeat protein